MMLSASAGKSFRRTVDSCLIVAGFQTRKFACTIAMFTVVAAVSFHMPHADLKEPIELLKDVALTGGLLQVIVFGGGRLALANNCEGD